jgi:hypothetical protein
MGHAATRKMLIPLQVVVAVAAVIGALVVVPGLPLDWIRRGPMTDFTVPAIALGLFVGGSAVVALGLLITDSRSAGVAAMVAGALIIAFEFVEIWVIGFAILVRGIDDPLAWWQVACIAIGVIGMALGYHLWHVPADPLAYLRHAH